MSMQGQLTLALQSIAQEINTLRLEIDTATGDLANLTTTAKNNLVAAINELDAAIGGGGVQINDAATTSTTEALSANEIGVRIQAAKDELVNGAGAAYDTLQELQTELQSNDTAIDALLAAQALRVRVDAAQTFTALQKQQARDNIDAVDTADVGDTNRDFAADFTGALS